MDPEQLFPLKPLLPPELAPELTIRASPALEAKIGVAVDKYAAAADSAKATLDLAGYVCLGALLLIGVMILTRLRRTA